MKTLRLVFVFLVGLISCVSVSAQDFEVDGIAYSIVSADEQTVEVVRDSDNPYSGDVTIPAIVMNDNKEYKVVGIGKNAFSNCSDLTSVVISEGVTSIGFMAFIDCIGLTSVIVPESVIAIFGDAFLGCSSLISINVDVGNEVYSSINGVLYNKQQTRILCCPGGIKGEIVIPSSVTSIEEYVFEECPGLTSINVDNDNSKYSSVNGVLYDKEQTEILCCPGGIKGDFIIPEGVISIGSYAFSGCRGLTSLVIPSSVTFISEGVFRNCIILTSINVDAGNEVYSSINGVLYNKQQTRILCCPKGLKGEFIIPEGVANIGYCAFSGCSGLTSVVIPESVVDFAERAFFGCSGLTSIVIPKSVTGISYGVFAYCTGLTSIVIPESVTVIGYSAFSDCKSLTSVVIPEGVTYIGDYAFYNCSGLTSVYLKWEKPIYSDKSIFECMDKNLYETATLYILEGTFPEYQKVEPWRFFRNIQSVSSIDSVKDNVDMYYSAPDETLYFDDENISVKVYDINGRMVLDVYGVSSVSVSELPHGAYIAVPEHGRSFKFLR